MRRPCIEGPILQIPRSSVRLDAQLDTLWAGFNIKFGGSKRKAPATRSSESSGSVIIPPPMPWGDSYDPPLPGPAGPGVAASDANTADGAVDDRGPRQAGYRGS